MKIKQINWKLLLWLLISAGFFAGIVLIAVNWNTIIDYSNWQISLTLLLSICLNTITVLNNLVSVIIKIFMIKNEKRKSEFLNKSEKQNLEILKIINDKSVTDNFKIKKIWEIFYEKEKC